MRSYRKPTPVPPRVKALVVNQTFLKPSEAAAILGVSKQYLYVLLNADLISHARVGKRFLIPRKAMEDYVARKLKEGSVA